MNVSVRFVGTLFLLFLTPFLASAQSVIPSLAKQEVTVGETVSAMISVEGTPLAAHPVVPPQGGLTIGSNPNRPPTGITAGSKRFFQYRYSVTATRAGDYQLLAISTDQNGQRKTIPFPILKVVDKPEAPEKPKDAMLQVKLAKDEVFEGELFPLEIDLLALHIGEVSFPQHDLDGFVIHKAPRPTQSRVPLDGQTYHRITFTKMLRAIQNGPRSIGPFTSTMELRVRNPQGRLVNNTIPIEHAAISINILPVPETGRPDAYSGMVGNIQSFNVQVSNTNLTTGGTASLDIRVRGEGSMENLQLFFPDEWRDFEIFPSKEQTQTYGNLGIQAEKVIEQVIAPSNSQLTQIPPIVIAAFDPNSRTFKIHTSAPIPIKVASPGSIVAGSVPTISIEASPSEAKANTEVAPIRYDLSVRPALHLLGIATHVALFVSLLLLLAALSIKWRFHQRQRFPSYFATRDRWRRMKKLEKEISKGECSTLSEDILSKYIRILQLRMAILLETDENTLTGSDLEIIRLAKIIGPVEAARYSSAFETLLRYKFDPDRSSTELSEIRHLIEETRIPPSTVFRRGSPFHPALVIILFLSLQIPLRATFEEANKAYNEGRFIAAVESYQSILDPASPQPVVLYNLGTAYLQMDERGRAIAHFSAALREQPRATDIRHNLSLARQKVSGGRKQIQQAFLGRFIRSLSLSEWRKLLSLTASVTMLLLAWRVLRPGRIPSFFIPPVLAFLALAAIFNLCALSAASTDDSAMLVIEKEVTFRFGPTKNSETLFVLNDGTEIQAIRHHGDWTFARDSAGRTGWVLTKGLLSPSQLFGKSP